MIKAQTTVTQPVDIEPINSRIVGKPEVGQKRLVGDYISTGCADNQVFIQTSVLGQQKPCRMATLSQKVSSRHPPLSRWLFPEERLGDRLLNKGSLRRGVWIAAHSRAYQHVRTLSARCASRRRQGRIEDTPRPKGGCSLSASVVPLLPKPQLAAGR